MELPKPMKCPKEWKYDEDWADRFREKYGYGYLSKLCKHGSAEYYILYFIYEYGQHVLTNIKGQNMDIKRLAEGKASLNIISYDNAVICRSGYDWECIDERWDELFEIYNAERTPKQILSILNEIRALIVRGMEHYEELRKYVIWAAEQERVRKEEEVWFELQKQSRVKEGLYQKWKAVDVKHSKVKEGFIYLLSNKVMPELYKIGFTSESPDSRAKELSQQHKLPAPFKVVQYWRTKDPYIVEQRIHEELYPYRQSGEFFKVDIDIAKSVISKHIIR